MARLRIEPDHQPDAQLALALLFPTAAGVALFGWRALGATLTVCLGAFLARAVLGRLRTWTATPPALPLAVQCVLVSLFLPATLFDLEQSTVQPTARWPALVAIGGAVGVFDWLRRWAATRRFHAGLLTIALLTLALPWLLETDRVLPPQKLVVGDVLSPHTAARPNESAEPWLETPPNGAAVLLTPPAERTLSAYLHEVLPPGRPNQTISRLLSDDLPPLEDLVVGGHPTPLGRGSIVMVLVGGLFLVYRGLTPLRVPALALLSCYATLAVLPLPIGVGDGGVRRLLFERDPRVGWAAGLTLVHYLLCTSTVPIVATFLLPLPGIRPRRNWAAAVFAVLFGVLAAVATVFINVAGGAVLALLLLQAVFAKCNACPLSRYAGGGLGRGTASLPGNSQDTADPLPSPPP